MTEKNKKIKCCWNEEKKEYYDCESIGINEYRCLGCYKKHKGT